jgi:hypothetical protein
MAGLRPAFIAYVLMVKMLYVPYHCMDVALVRLQWVGRSWAAFRRWKQSYISLCAHSAATCVLKQRAERRPCTRSALPPEGCPIVALTCVLSAVLLVQLRVSTM